MIICILCFICIAYNALYLTHCVNKRRFVSAFGSAAVIGLIAAGVLLLGFDAAW